ncbi:Xanthine and CO dehydrogenases maturation factor, XdhC/CoxF family [hydrothermal vent metagenome]|uniref:Xanthine and CO dehydrogenases maturation factor, XdhC/CoxF family n=1 Tax=hydrothermal vent metagenome TaxID=652676 RepID=A0A3B0RW12_9ZZZZ
MHSRIIHVVMREVRGSSPRDAGAEMFVAEAGISGTIGGGRLEYIVTLAAREMLAAEEAARHLDQPLGPEIGQCCGGRVELDLTLMSAEDKARVEARLRAAQDAQPHVYVMGAGHVGRALADLMQFLPVRCILVDSREGELSQVCADVETRLMALPEHDIVTAPAGSGFIILTHEHSLDFLLASEALKRGDAAYVGLIGSRSKRAKFRNFCTKECDGLSIDDLICPIGAGGSRDKRPSVIAASVVAEVMAAVL